MKTIILFNDLRNWYYVLREFPDYQTFIDDQIRDFESQYLFVDEVFDGDDSMLDLIRDYYENVHDKIEMHSIQDGGELELICINGNIYVVEADRDEYLMIITPPDTKIVWEELPESPITLEIVKNDIYYIFAVSDSEGAYHSMLIIHSSQILRILHNEESGVGKCYYNIPDKDEVTYLFFIDKEELMVK